MHKPIPQKAIVSRPRFHQLEEHELRKMVFTGDSYYAYDQNPEITAKKEAIDRVKRKEISQTAIANKQIFNAKAEMETQPVDTSSLAKSPTEGTLQLPQARRST